MEAEMNPVFNYEHLSFIWNYFDEHSHAYSWLLRFNDATTEEKFQEAVMHALWERLNRQRWLKSNDEERDYVLQAFEGDVEMPDQSDDDDDEEETLGHHSPHEYGTALSYDKAYL
jgi:VID27 PH-like domain